MDNEKNELFDEAVKLVSDITIPAGPILHILAGDEAYDEMSKKCNMVTTACMFDLVRTSESTLDIIQGYIDKVHDAENKKRDADILYELNEELKELKDKYNSDNIKYCPVDSFDILKKPEFTEFFGEEFFNKVPEMVDVITNAKYFNLAGELHFRLRHNTSYIGWHSETKAYYEKRMEIVYRNIGNILSNVYTNNTIFDYGVMTSILLYLSDNNEYAVRDIFVKKYGFWIFNKQNLENLKEFIGDSKVLEIMAGTGYIGHILSNNGIDVLSVDNGSLNHRFDVLYKRDECMDCLDAIRKYGEKYDVLLMSWVPYQSDIGAQAMKLYHEINPNGAIIWIGEGEGGCCGDDCDFEVMDEIGRSIELEEIFNNNFEQFDGIHDEAYIMDPTGERKMTKYVRVSKEFMLDEDIRNAVADGAGIPREFLINDGIFSSISNIPLTNGVKQLLSDSAFITGNNKNYTKFTKFDG